MCMICLVLNGNVMVFFCRRIVCCWVSVCGLIWLIDCLLSFMVLVCVMILLVSILNRVDLFVLFGFMSVCIFLVWILIDVLLRIFCLLLICMVSFVLWSCMVMFIFWSDGVCV